MCVFRYLDMWVAEQEHTALHCTGTCSSLMLAVLQKQTIKQVQLEKVTRTFVQIRDACRLNCRNIHARDLPLAVSTLLFPPEMLMTFMFSLFSNISLFHLCSYCLIFQSDLSLAME